MELCADEKVMPLMPGDKDFIKNLIKGFNKKQLHIKGGNQRKKGLQYARTKLVNFNNLDKENVIDKVNDMIDDLKLRIDKN